MSKLYVINCMIKIMYGYWVFIRKNMCLIKNKVVKFYNMLGTYKKLILYRIPIIVDWIFPSSVQNNPNSQRVNL